MQEIWGTLVMEVDEKNRKCCLIKGMCKYCEKNEKEEGSKHCNETKVL